MSKHTPGPWDCSPSAFMSCGNDKQTYFIVSRNSGGMADNERGNANLIAAAPEMFEALKTVFDLSHDSNSNPHELLSRIGQIAEDAIKKKEVE